MTTIDFAFLAEFAKLDGGNLTAVGAGWERVVIPRFLQDQALQVYIAGRALTESVEEGIVLFEIITPNEGVRAQLEVPSSSFGMGGALFAFNAPIPLQGEGQYRVQISVGGVVLRDMALEVAFDKEEPYIESTPGD